MNIWGSVRGQAKVFTIGTLGGTTVLNDMVLHGDTRYDSGWDSRTDYGLGTIRYIPFMVQSSYLYFYFQATSAVMVMPPAKGAGSAEAKVRVDPLVEFDQAAFDQQAVSLGFPTFSLSEYFQLSAGQAPDAVSPAVNVSAPDLVAASDTGPSGTDNITGDRTPTLTGTVENPLNQAGMPPATLAVLYIDGVRTAKATIKNGIYTLTSSAIAPGQHSVMVAAGVNENYLSMPSDPLQITIDASLPDGGKPPKPGTITVPGGDLTLGAGGVKAITFTDADGTSATLKLSGGSAAVHFEGSDLERHVANNATTMTGTGVRLGSITLSGQTGKAVLSLAVKKGPNDDGRIELGGLVCPGAIGSVAGKNVDLAGDVIVGGLAGSLLLADVVGGQRVITLGGVSGDKGAMVTLGSVADLDLISTAPVKSLTVGSWLDSDDDDNLLTPALGKLTCTGNFKADLTIASQAPASSLPVLGLTRIGGEITGGTWQVIGNTDAIAAGRINAGFSATVSGTVKSVTTAGSLAGTIQALSIGSFKIGGDLDGASITLTQAPLLEDPRSEALGSLTVSGTMNNSSLDSQGHLGKISLGRMIGSSLFAGVDTARNALGVLPDEPLDFAAMAQLDSLTITGIKNQPMSFQNSFVAAAKLGSISLLDLPTDHSAAGGLAGTSLTKNYLRKAGKSTACRLTGPKSAAMTIDQLDGFIARLV